MMKLTSIEGNRQWLDGGSMFGNAPKAVWQRWTDIDSLGRIPLACRSLLIEVDGLKILCEAGIGAFFPPKLAERFGVETPQKHCLLENLNKLGIDESDIDYVVLSHLHFDHAGGLLPTYEDSQKNGDRLVFSKAQFIVGEDAWQRARHPHSRDKASFVPTLNQLLETSGRLIIVKDLAVPEPLKSYLSFFQSEGHTPGQMHTVIRGKNEAMVFTGDLVPGVPWVHVPITMGYDRYPEKLIDEKLALYEQFSNHNLWLFFTHDAKYACGQIVKNEKAKFTASKLQETLQQWTLS